MFFLFFNAIKLFRSHLEEHAKNLVLKGTTKKPLLLLQQKEIDNCSAKKAHTFGTPGWQGLWNHGLPPYLGIPQTTKLISHCLNTPRCGNPKTSGFM